MICRARSWEQRGLFPEASVLTRTEQRVLILNAASLGFEPRQRDSESLVLPLHYEATSEKNKDRCASLQVAQLPSRMNLRGGDLLCFEQDFAALLSPCDFQMASALCREFASGLYHRVYHLVVMTRIMMKQQKRLNLRFECERNGAGDRTVSPADVRLIFLVGVFRVENQNVGCRAKTEPTQRAGPSQFFSLSSELSCFPRAAWRKNSYGS